MHSEHAPRPCRVLIVDDDVDTVDLLALVLELHGHNVLKAYTGSAAVQLALELTPEVVLLDIVMPEVNGLDVCQKIRAALPSVYIIAVTGWQVPDARKRAQAAGFDAFMLKPVLIDALLERIANHCEAGASERNATSAKGVNSSSTVPTFAGGSIGKVHTGKVQASTRVVQGALKVLPGRWLRQTPVKSGVSAPES